MGKGLAFDNDLLKLIFNATTIANIAINATSSPLTVLYVSLHTADPSGGDQLTDEIAYTSYARVSVNRNSGGWAVTGNSVSPASNIVFPTSTGGGGIATHFGIGKAASGAGRILYTGTLFPSIECITGVVPIISTDTTIEET